jgi:amino acid transporter
MVRWFVFDRPTSSGIHGAFDLIVFHIFLLVNIIIFLIRKKVESISKINFILKLIFIFILVFLIWTYFHAIYTPNPHFTVKDYWESGEWKW